MVGDHEIYIADETEERIAWECSCGHGGSVPDYLDPDLAAWKHIKEGESVVYISRPQW